MDLLDKTTMLPIERKVLQMKIEGKSYTEIVNELGLARGSSIELFKKNMEALQQQALSGEPFKLTSGFRQKLRSYYAPTDKADKVRPVIERLLQEKQLTDVVQYVLKNWWEEASARGYIKDCRGCNREACERP